MTSLKIKVGSKSKEKGETFAEIQSNGTIFAKNYYLKDVTDCDVKVPEEEVVRLEMELNSLEYYKPKRKPVPDEEVYEFEFTKNDKTIIIKILQNDLNEYPELKKQIKNISNLLFAKSNKKILL